ADPGGAHDLPIRSGTQHLQLRAIGRGALEPFELGGAAFAAAQVGAPYRDRRVAFARDIAVIDLITDTLRDGAHALATPAATSPSSTGRMCSGRVVRRFLAMSSKTAAACAGVMSMARASSPASTSCSSAHSARS